MLCKICGHDNPDENRFCGMCGSALNRSPVAAGVSAYAASPATRPVATPIPPPRAASGPPASISGPSFLGLSPEEGDPNYLLDDEPRGHVRLYLAVLVLVVFGLLAGMQWRHSGYEFHQLLQHVQQRQPQAQGQASPPSQNAAQPANAASPALVPAGQEPAAAQPAASAAAGESNHRQATSSAGSQQQASAGDAQRQEQPAKTREKNAAAAAQQPVKDDAEADHSGDSAAADNLAPQPAARTSPASQNSERLARQQKAQQQELIASANKYLYGRGVPRSCDLALTYLHEAADKAAPQAFSQIGALYATGQCVPRDRPAAYRWLALALQHDRNNVYLQKNLVMLWNQMSGDERQRATRITDSAIEKP